MSGYLNRGSSRSPNSIIAKEESPKEYQLTRDEFEFTKEYLNKDFKKYDHLESDIRDIYKKLDYEDYERHSKKKKDGYDVSGVAKLSKIEIERLRKSLFNESDNGDNNYYGDNINVKTTLVVGGSSPSPSSSSLSYNNNNNSSSGSKKTTDLRDYELQKPDYIIKNSEFLQKSNELLSKIITKERNYKKPEGSVVIGGGGGGSGVGGINGSGGGGSGSIRDIDNRLISDYNRIKILKDSTSSSSSSSGGSNGLRSKDELSLQNYCGSIRLRTGSLSRSYDDKDSDKLKYDIDNVRLDKHHSHHHHHHHQQQHHHHHHHRQNDKNYSTSEDESIDRTTGIEKNVDGISGYTKGIAYLLAGYNNRKFVFFITFVCLFV